MIERVAVKERRLTRTRPLNGIPLAYSPRMEQLIIIVRFRWTADELVRAYRYHFRHLYRPVWRFAAHFLFALNIWIGFCMIRSGMYVPLGIALMVVGVYWSRFAVGSDAG